MLSHGCECSIDDVSALIFSNVYALAENVAILLKDEHLTTRSSQDRLKKQCDYCFVMMSSPVKLFKAAWPKVNCASF